MPRQRRFLGRRVIGAGEALRFSGGGFIDLTYTGARTSGAAAFAEAGGKLPVFAPA